MAKPTSTTETVKEVVKDSLLGVDEPASLSASHRTSFYKNAKKDEGTGELVMGPDEFIEAIAPADEDYVSILYYYQQLEFPVFRCSCVLFTIGQNQARAVWPPIPSRRPQTDGQDHNRRLGCI